MSRFTLEDYTSALQNLLPTGLVWTRKADGVQSAVMRALAQSYQQSDQAAESLLTGAFPATTTIMLTDWEKTLGLPDDCAIGEIDSIAIRQKSIVSKLFSTGGQSAAYFIGVAKALGYTISITFYRQARAGMSVCGDALNGDDWPFTWLVTAPQTTITYAQAGQSYAGDPLRSWGNKRLECRLTKLAPSHTIVKFGYAS
ncbi:MULTISPECIES: YmfQ family protein [Rahnella]|uniref:YmfQ family protein n=1 Tax=Rahnella laticis TaxID=2787622 RepID=A0ABS0E0K8_9GAMM|nr:MULTISPECIES: YmfQ family protein [Rahnella]MBF7978652.1 YmfQ family protein [Rahnella laticis]MBF7998742.1 YmfQ family protein [Rahnella sp. LAC-M12]